MSVKSNLPLPKVAFKDRIRATEMYKKLIPVLQSIILKRNNVAYIKHGYTVAKNIGYKNWLKQSDYKERNQIIIKELLEQDKS